MYKNNREGVAQPGKKRERTRALLIRCASEIVGEKGFERTSLEEVAQRARVTRGSIYNNFKSRDDLFLAVAEALWEPINPPETAGASLAEQMEALGEAIIAGLPERRARAVGAASFVAYALSHEDLRIKLVAANSKVYEGMATRIIDSVPSDQLPMPAESFVKVVHALIEGIFTLGSLTPELISESTIRDAFRMFAK